MRRRVPLEELDDDEHTPRHCPLCVDSRLVTVDEDTVEVAHEALLREWPRLRAWLEEDADGRRAAPAPDEAARDWQAAGRDHGELYRGARLAAALEWAAGHARRPQRARARVPRREPRRGRARDRAAAAGEPSSARAGRRASPSLLARGAAAPASWRSTSAARPATRRCAADAQRLGADGAERGPPRRGPCCSRAHGVALDDSATTRSNLLVRARAQPGGPRGSWTHGSEHVRRGHQPRRQADGDSATTCGDVDVYDAATRLPVGPAVPDPGRAHPGRPLLARRATRSRSALSTARPRRAQRAGRPDRSTHRRAAGCACGCPRCAGPLRFVYADVVFLPNGRDLLVRPVAGGAPDGPASPIYRVDRATGAMAGRLHVGRHASAYDASATADGAGVHHQRGATTGPGSSTAERLRVARSWPVGDADGVGQPGRRRSSRSAPPTGGVRLLDLRSGQVRAAARAATTAPVRRMRFTPDWRTLVTTGDRRAGARLGRRSGGTIAAALPRAQRCDRRARHHAATGAR